MGCAMNSVNGGRFLLINDSWLHYYGISPMTAPLPRLGPARSPRPFSSLGSCESMRLALLALMGALADCKLPYDPHTDHIDDGARPSPGSVCRCARAQMSRHLLVAKPQPAGCPTTASLRSLNTSCASCVCGTVSLSSAASSRAQRASTARSSSVRISAGCPRVAGATQRDRTKGA